MFPFEILCGEDQNVFLQCVSSRAGSDVTSTECSFVGDMLVSKTERNLVIVNYYLLGKEEHSILITISNG